MNINPFCAGGFNPAQPWPYGTGCDCCDAPSCAECVGTQPDSPDHPSTPCCRGGNCAQCQTISGDIPWLMPKAIGCGRTHKCGDDVDYQPLNLNGDSAHTHYRKQLDGVSLPGRPPHTVVSARSVGTSSWAVTPGSGQPCSANDMVKAQDYDLTIKVEIAVELIVRDCCGYQYCLRSFIQDTILIPLCILAYHVRDSSDFLFLKSRVKLCAPYSVPSGISADATPGMPVGSSGMRLDVLMEACVVRLVPYGVLGFDPYSCQQPLYNRI